MPRRRLSVTLPPERIGQARVLGGGNASAGCEAALAALDPDPRRPDPPRRPGRPLYEGAPVVGRSIYLTAEQWAFLREYGEGNLNLGVRRLLAYHGVGGPPPRRRRSSP